MQYNRLLCTFSNKQDFLTTLTIIKKQYSTEKDIEVYSDIDNSDRIFLIYNCDTGNTNKLSDTISIHKKTKYNSFFTVNAINSLEEKHNGEIEWDEYNNCIILFNNKLSQLMITNLKFEINF
jgi:hypothetical protein